MEGSEYPFTWKAVAEVAPRQSHPAGGSCGGVDRATRYLLSFTAIQYYSLTRFPSFVEYPNNIGVPAMLALSLAVIAEIINRAKLNFAIYKRQL
jgi:hypothetical protein